MIEIRNLNKLYGDTPAVRDLTLTVNPGEVFAFLGPNGAGKTTTIKIISGLLRPNSGNVLICGHDIIDEPDQAKSKLSYVPDQPHLYDKLSGREFLTMVA